VADLRELSLPNKGIFILRDCETDEEFFADFSSAKTRKNFLDIHKRNNEQLKALFKKYKIDYIDIHDEENYEKPLFDFFLERKRKFSR
jgi:hypothetical protein